jgi:hypothetical protein
MSNSAGPGQRLIFVAVTVTLRFVRENRLDCGSEKIPLMRG